MKRFIAVFFIIAALAGCGGVEDLSMLPNDQLMALGDEAIQNRKYKKAFTYFRSVILNADNPDNARYAQRKMSDAYFLNKDYLDAIAGYEVYYDMYRNSEDYPYVLYMLGLSYSKISLKAPRDQSFTQDSVRYFDELEIRYPDKYEEYQADVVKKQMVEKLALHEHFVARYYLRVKSPDSAITRLVYLINNYPDAEITKEAYLLLISTTIKQGDSDIARLYIDEFKMRYPNNAAETASYERKL